jgi:hypothetical protein
VSTQSCPLTDLPGLWPISSASTGQESNLAGGMSEASKRGKKGRMWRRSTDLGEGERLGNRSNWTCAPRTCHFRGHYADSPAMESECERWGEWDLLSSNVMCTLHTNPALNDWKTLHATRRLPPSNLNLHSIALLECTMGPVGGTQGSTPGTRTHASGTVAIQAQVVCYSGSLVGHAVAEAECMGVV